MKIDEKQLRQRFRELLRRVNEHYPLRADLVIGTAREFPADRDYAYCGWDDGTEEAEIVVAPKMLRANKGRREGVLRHELAHAYLLSEDLVHTEAECDRMAEAIFGSPIFYDADDVQTTDKRAGVNRRRPGRLPTGLE